MLVWRSHHDELMAAADRRYKSQQDRIAVQKATIRDLETALHDAKADFEASEAKCNQLLREDSQKSEQLRAAIGHFLRIISNPFAVTAFNESEAERVTWGQAVRNLQQVPVGASPTNMGTPGSPFTIREFVEGLKRHGKD